MNLFICKYALCNIGQVISILQMNLEWFIYAVFIECQLCAMSHKDYNI